MKICAIRTDAGQAVGAPGGVCEQRIYLFEMPEKLAEFIRAEKADPYVNISIGINDEDDEKEAPRG